MISEATTKYDRKPLRIRSSETVGEVHTDSMQVLKPGDHKYEESFRRATRDHKLYGIEMPYADEYDGVKESDTQDGLVFESILAVDDPYIQARSILTIGSTPEESFVAFTESPIAEQIGEDTWRQLDLLGYRQISEDFLNDHRQSDDDKKRR